VLAEEKIEGPFGFKNDVALLLAVDLVAEPKMFEDDGPEGAKSGFGVSELAFSLFSESVAGGVAVLKLNVGKVFPKRGLAGLGVVLVNPNKEGVVEAEAAALANLIGVLGFQVRSPAGLGFKGVESVDRSALEIAPSLSRLTRSNRDFPAFSEGRPPSAPSSSSESRSLSPSPLGAGEYFAKGLLKAPLV